jgi:hypothetical protein
MWAVRACLTFLAGFTLTVCTIAQSVISTHSGVIYYFDGSVCLNDQPLESHLGKFPSVPEGGELRTAKGHAEVLLTPGVFLRMGDNSSIRMLSNDLANTRVELQAGSAIVDSGEASSHDAVTLVFRDWRVRSAQPGAYRIDSDPPHLWVLKGDAEVFAGTERQPVTVKQGMDLPFASKLAPEPTGAEPADGLSDWAKGRSDSIAADDAITQQIDSDPASQTAGIDGLDGFTNFPILGVPPVGLYSTLYNSVVPSEPGFYSLYLPGYASPPLLLVIVGRSLGPRFPVAPISIGIPPRIGFPPTSNPVTSRPIVLHPAAAHSAPAPPPHSAAPHPVAHR